MYISFLLTSSSYFSSDNGNDPDAHWLPHGKARNRVSYQYLSLLSLTSFNSTDLHYPSLFSSRGPEVVIQQNMGAMAQLCMWQMVRNSHTFLSPFSDTWHRTSLLFLVCLFLMNPPGNSFYEGHGLQVKRTRSDGSRSLPLLTHVLKWTELNWLGINSNLATSCNTVR